MSGFFAALGARKRVRLDQALEELAEALSRNQLDRAIERGHAAVAEAERLFGPTHAELATPLYGLASALLARGEIDAASRTISRAVDCLATAKPKMDREGLPTRSQLLELWASVASRRGNGAEAVLERWIEACRADGDSERARLATALNQLGLARGAAGDRDAAAPLFEEALALRRAIFGAHGREAAEVLYNAATLRPCDRPAEAARDDLARVVDEAVGDDEASTKLRGSASHNLGVVLEELGDLDGARQAFERALALREKTLGAEHFALRPTLVKLGQIAQAQGRVVFAAVVFERARALAEKELGAGHEVTEALLAWKRSITEG